jgi:hypothetical protein
VSLATTIGAGTLLGTVLAIGVYTAVAPDDTVPAAVEVAPTYGPVPTPTVTVEAEGCADPAVLEDGECVVHAPGPTVTVTPAAPAPAPAAAARATSDGYAEHEDGEHEGEHEHEHEDHEDEPGEHDDD